MQAAGAKRRISVPWRDADGQFSALKACVFCVLLLPALWMGYETLSGHWDFPSPYVPLIYHSGLWATYLLLASLAVTPARHILRFGRLVRIRRMVGLAAFFYTLGHIIAWFGLRFWDFASLAEELGRRPSLIIATLSTLGLAALAATSFDRVIARMGGAAWNRLHRTIYWLAGLAVLHFLLSPGALQGLPYLMVGTYVWLMGWRVLNRAGRGTDPLALVGLALAAGAFTLLFEPLWIALVHAENALYPPLETLSLNFDTRLWPHLGVPPVWQVLAGGGLAAAFAYARRSVSPTGRGKTGTIPNGAKQ